MTKVSSAKEKDISSKSPKNQNSGHLLFLKITIVVFLSVLLLVSVSLSTFWILLLDRFYPGISIAQVNISTLTKDQAKQKIIASLDQKTSKPLTFITQDQTKATIELSLKDGIKTEAIDQAIDQAFAFGHSKLFLSPQNIPLQIEFTEVFANQLAQMRAEVNQEPINSQLKVEGTEINVTPSQDGVILDEHKLKQAISSFINTGFISTSTIPTKKAYPTFPYTTALRIKQRLDQIKLSPIKLQFEDKSFFVDLSVALSLIDLEKSENSLISTSIGDKKIQIENISLGEIELFDTKLSLNKEKVDQYLSSIAQSIDRPVEEPLFNFDPSAPTKVKEFKPPIIGLQLNKMKTSEALAKAFLTENQSQIDLPVEKINPKNKLTNDLGIKELIGQGVSNFAGSIENRIYNVNHAASKINGVLIPPGEEFSFDNTVGDITAATGYKQAYVIKSGRTVLDDGGGVCQVSTTIFRAALYAGLPITARTAHAYRVSYYEQGFPPGLDATIFYPSVDFKFKNDTPGHILIQAYSVGTTLYVDLYGTSDGRVTNLTKPVITNHIPPPPELRQDDPTLPKGTVKQVDWAAAGANVLFTRTVTKGGQTIINETFKSNYRPWQAVFLVGTKEG